MLKMHTYFIFPKKILYVFITLVLDFWYETKKEGKN